MVDFQVGYQVADQYQQADGKSSVATVWAVLVLDESQQSVHIPWVPHWVPISVTGFTSPSMGDGSNTGPMEIRM